MCHRDSEWQYLTQPVPVSHLRQAAETWTHNTSYWATITRGTTSENKVKTSEGEGYVYDKDRIGVLFHFTKHASKDNYNNNLYPKLLGCTLTPSFIPRCLSLQRDEGPPSRPHIIWQARPVEEAITQLTIGYTIKRRSVHTCKVHKTITWFFKLRTTH